MNSIEVYYSMTYFVEDFGQPFWLVIMSLFYIVPVFSFFRIKVSSNFMLRINELAGMIDKYFFHFRFLINAFMLCIFGASLVLNFCVEKIVLLLIAVFLVITDGFHRHTKWKKIAGFLPLIKQSTAPYYKTIFRMFDSSSGPFFPVYRNAIKEIDIKSADFRKTKINVFFAIKRGIFSTIRFAKFIANISKKMGHDTAQSIAQPISASWALSIVKECASAIIIKRAEFIDNVFGRVVYVFTHSSFLDFAIAPLVVAFRKQSGMDVNLPMFILAKDHFWHNPLYRYVLGIGKAAKALDMIFVSRKGKVEDAKSAVEKSVKAIETGKDVVIFPQGARAHGRFDKLGNRIEAGYYAVGNTMRMSQESSHLKKGVAHIGFELSGLKEPVWFIPIAIKGTSVICPKNSRKIKPNQFIELIFGRPISTMDMSEQDVSNWLTVIDNELKSSHGINSFLERCFLEDMRRVIQQYELEELSLAIKPWRDHDHLIYSILDIIYSIKPSDRLMYLSELAKLILNNSDRKLFLDFKKKIALAIK